MANILDYLDWRGDLTMDQSPFNEVDNVILSQLAYVNFDDIVPAKGSHGKISIQEAAEYYFNRYSDEQIQSYGIILRQCVCLLKKMANSARFAEAMLSQFQNVIDFDETKQFSAIHIKLSDDTVYVAYRGTDDTIIGWKENFNMSFLTTIPAQLEAVRYLEDTAHNIDLPLRLGGHSKGGNLAIYAAMMCEEDLKRRIVYIYNNDGPGFDAEIVGSDAYKKVSERIHMFVPQFSIVGMLLEHDETYTVVKSNQRMIMQHDAFSWEVLGSKFITAEQVAKESRLIEAALKSWMNQLSETERKQFVDNAFRIFEEADVWTIDDLSQSKWRKVSQMVRALNQSQEHKVVLVKALRILFREGRKVFLSSRQGMV